MLKWKPCLAFVCCSAAWLYGEWAYAGTYTISPGEPNQIIFESKAPLESFEGKTRDVSGFVDWQPGNPGAGIRVEVEVQMATFDTGIALRNKHMRENHLETEKFPTAVFRGGTIAELPERKLKPGDTLSFDLGGEMTLHGVSKAMTVPISITVEENGLHVETEFPINLNDFDIKRPKFLVMKLNETQQVRVTLLARSGGEGSQK